MAKVKLTAGRRASGFPVRRGQGASLPLVRYSVPGLAVRATPGSTAKRYIFQAKVKGQTMRLTIGPVSAWGIDAAQAEARRLQILIDQGDDPRQVKADKANAKEAALLAKEADAIALMKQQARASATVGHVWEEYITARRAKWSERHLFDHRKVIQPASTKGKDGARIKTLVGGVLSPLAQLALSDLSPNGLANGWKRKPRNVRHKPPLAFRLLRAFINWCNERDEYKGIAAPDACARKVSREHLPKAKAKNDALQREQLRLWFDAVRRIPNPTIAAYLQGLLITGARRNELTGLRWEEVDFQWNSITIRDKVEGERTIPLTPYLPACCVTCKEGTRHRPPCAA
jgi:integrase